jgi:Cu/Ag efflux protein CusF
MQTKIVRGLALAAIAVSIAGLAPRAVADEGTSHVKGETIADSISVSATVEAIDLDKRIVTLRDENGAVSDIKVGKEVRNLDQVKTGDHVVATYHEAIAYEVFKPGTAMPGANEAMVAERAKHGEKPAAGVAQIDSVTATITKIDKADSKVTLKGPEGHSVTVKVKDPKKLEGVNVGDLVQLTYTQALAIAVKPAAAK